MRWVLTIFLLIFFLEHNAQTGSFAYGGALTETLTKILSLNNGYLLIGNSSSNVNENNQVLFVQIDTNFQLINSFKIGSDKDEYCTDAIILSDGSVLATGFSRASNSGYDVFLIRTSLNGQILNFKTLNFSEKDIPRKVLLDPVSGNIILVANSIRDNTTYGSIYILNQLFDVQRQYELQLFQNETAISDLILSNDTFIVSGSFLRNQGNQRGFILVLENNFQSILLDTSGVGRNEIIESAIKHSGRWWQLGAINNIDNTETDYLIKIYNNDFNVKNLIDYPILLSNESIIAGIGDINNHAFLLGNYDGKAGFGAGKNDFHLLKLDSNGGLIVGQTFGYFDEEVPTTLLYDRNKLIMGGSTRSIGYGVQNIWLVYTDTSVSRHRVDDPFQEIDLVNSTDTTISLSNQILFEKMNITTTPRQLIFENSNLTELSSIEIFSLSGKLISIDKVTTSNYLFKSKIKPGVYLVKVRSDEKEWIKKIFIDPN